MQDKKRVFLPLIFKEVRIMPETEYFNEFANPKIETKRFKIYADVSTTSGPTWELQGRGVESWTVDENQDIQKPQTCLGMSIWIGSCTANTKRRFC